MANSYLYKNQGTATNAKKFTYSVWLKRSAIDTSASQRFYQGWQSSDNRFYAYFVEGADSNEDRLWIYAVTGGTVEVYWVSNRRFRDTNAWYHIVFSADSTQASQGDRFKVYVNGVEETSWTKTNNPSQNIDWGNQLAQSSGDLTISGTESQTQLFEGYMSHVAFVDGQALAPTVFGETDSTSGIWKFKSPSGVTWGNTGYHLKMENSANLGLDSSGNTNNFTVGGNLKQAVDTPSNVSATLNPLNSTGNGTEPTYSIGNLQSVSPSSGGGFVGSSTLGVSSGKYYFEIQRSAGTSSNVYIGIGDEKQTREIARQSASAIFIGNAVYYKPDDGNKVIVTNGSGVESSYGATYGNGDKIGIALNMDDNQVTFYKNGASQGVITIPTPDGACFLNVINGADTSDTFQVNFGNGYFGTTAISSAGSNGNGSLFEYDVPSGYYALNTKNINTYG